MLIDYDIYKHPAYGDSLRTAVRRARSNPGDCFSVYWDGTAIYVRASEAVPPPASKIVCIAQVWDANTVQLRFADARSEFVKD